MADDYREAPNPYTPPAAALETAPPDDLAETYVIYRYAVSIGFLTYYGHSDPIAVRAGKNDWTRALLYSLLSLLLGWWGLPWGPIRTIQSVIVNLGGGQDVTPLQNRRVYKVENPGAKWTCPKCNQSNSNLTFTCVCGYRLV
ncbi:MAG TPA: hypothetical protein VKQ32_09020 [Polyangia bacterium]|nr:hypothetical protein [Polyangia bacterium]